MYSKDELKNILAIMSQARTEGIQAAATLVALFHKTQTLIQAPEKADGSDDVSNGPESNPNPAS